MKIYICLSFYSQIVFRYFHLTLMYNAILHVHREVVIGNLQNFALHMYGHVWQVASDVCDSRELFPNIRTS